jgi:hypothetical protein
MNAGKDQRRAEPGLARRQYVKGRCLAGERLKTPPQIGKHLVGHPCAHPAGVGELAVVRIVAKQQRPKMRPRVLRVRPADDDELLAV